MSASRVVIGLTGGIGSGKSTVANLFAALGVTLVDADQIAHALTAPNGAAIEAIRARFGSQFLTADHALDRQSMRELVFTRPAAKVDLEAILHPMIGLKTQEAIDRASGPYVMNVVPLLFESKRWQGRYTRTVVVDCTRELQIERVIERSGLSADQVEAIMAQQAPRALRLELADDVIDNSGDPGALVEPVRALHERYLKL